MGVIVNCESKEYFIGLILQMPEKAQEDLQKLIERALHKLSIELTEATIVTDSTVQKEL